MDIAALWLGWLLVWALGVALIAALYGRSTSFDEAGEIAFVAGCGWFVGQFLLTLWMRLLAAVHVPFGIATIGAPLAALIALATWFSWQWHRAIAAPRARAAWHALVGETLGKEQRLLWFGVLGWLALRFALLLIEVVRRPLYPWDAWTQWATKARVWSELKTIAPFVAGPEWLGTPAAGVYFDAAPHYPATVPL